MRIPLTIAVLSLTALLGGCIDNAQDKALIEKYKLGAKHVRLMRTCKRQMTERNANFERSNSLSDGCACVASGIRDAIDRKFDDFADTTLKILFATKHSVMLLTEVALQAKWMENNDISERETQAVLKAAVRTFARCGYDLNKARRLARS